MFGLIFLQVEVVGMPDVTNYAGYEAGEDMG